MLALPDRTLCENLNDIFSFWHFRKSLFYRMNNLLIRSARNETGFICCRKWYIGVFVTMYSVCVFVWPLCNRESNDMTIYEINVGFASGNLHTRCRHLTAVVFLALQQNAVGRRHEPIYTYLSCITFMRRKWNLNAISCLSYAFSLMLWMHIMQIYSNNLWMQEKKIESSKLFTLRRWDLFNASILLWGHH